MVTSIPVACAACLILESFEYVPWHALVTVWAWSFFMLLMWCSLYFSINQWQQSSMEKERLLRAESELREARLLALRYQLNPHFLFNSLNAVSTLVLDGNGPAATRMLAQIGDLLRTSLDSEVTAEVPLSQELAFTEGYLAIEQTRLGKRLRINIAVPMETRDALVPSMLLQPLVENAVRYGVAPLIEGGWIAIKSALDGDRLRIVVGNSGRRQGEPKKNGSGIGLGNTAERLKTLYGRILSSRLCGLKRAVARSCWNCRYAGLGASWRLRRARTNRRRRAPGASWRRSQATQIQGCRDCWGMRGWAVRSGKNSGPISRCCVPRHPDARNGRF